MKFEKLKKIILCSIILIAIFLRFYQLGSVPISPDWDEAALGYNAYSILETGKDEHGKFMPLILESFGDFKPALYTYFAAPFIKTLGLTTFAVRLPSAIAGVIGVIFTYFLVIELFGVRRHKFPHRLDIPKPTECLALLSAFLFAISPWDIQFSRVAFESQVGLVLNIGAVLFFLKGLRSGFFLSIAAVFASASVYMYQSEKVFLPILFITLAAIYWKEITGLSKKYIIAAFACGFILCLPMIASLVFDPSSLSRAKGVSVFSGESLSKSTSIEKIADDNKRGDYLGLVLDNRRVEYAKLAVAGYISHFSPNWLFITGDTPRHHAPGMGLEYLVLLPFLLIGAYDLLFGNHSRKTKLTLLAMILIAPIPAAVTKDVPHAVRTINFLPSLSILIALGILASYKFINNFKPKVLVYSIYLLFVFLFAFNFLYFANQYFVQQNHYTAIDWQYGYQQAVDDIKVRGKGFSKIIVSDKKPLDQSYIFFLYYLGYPPDQYQKEGKKEDGTHVFGKYTFKSIDSKDPELKGALIVTGPEGVENLTPSKIIYYPDGSEAIKIFEN